MQDLLRDVFDNVLCTFAFYIFLLNGGTLQRRTPHGHGTRTCI